MELMLSLARLLLYAVSGAVIMGVALALFLVILARLTPIKEWDELKKGNMAVAVYFAATVVSLGMVLAALLWPTERKLMSADPIEIRLAEPEQVMPEIAPAPAEEAE
jgi:hypothetical protein